jgi:hypothetical protein
MIGRRGSALIETVLFLPILLMLFIGTVELARIGWIYFTLSKQLYLMARYVGTQEGVNFCDDSDAAVAAAKNLAVRGSTDDSNEPILPDFTTDMVSLRLERYSADSEDLGECDCSNTGCDIATGGRQPDYIVASIPDGYPVRLIIPLIPSDPIPLRPRVRVPFGGT